MGILSSLNPFAANTPETARAAEVRAGTRAPTRTERRQCWDARDSYFACLDSNDIVDALSKDGEPKAAKACAAQSTTFERDCAREWVAYFKKWRVADYNKRMRVKLLEEEGAKAVAITGGPGGPPGGGK